MVVKNLTSPLFLATKLEAFAGGGDNDLFPSKDAEDILLIIDGCMELLKEIQGAAPEIRLFIKNIFKRSCNIGTSTAFWIVIWLNNRVGQILFTNVFLRSFSCRIVTPMHIEIQWLTQHRTKTTDNRGYAGVGIRQDKL